MFVIIAWAKFFAPKGPPPSSQNNKPAATAPASPVESPPARNPSSAPPPGSTAAPAAPAAAKSDTRERTIAIENGLYRVEFSNRGAVVRSWQLKKYKDDAKPQRILDLVHPDASQELSAWPLSVSLSDGNLDQSANAGLYQVSGASLVAGTPHSLDTSDIGTALSFTAPVTVIVAPLNIPQILTFVANPQTIDAGQSTKLCWQVSGATNITITPGVGSNLQDHLDLFVIAQCTGDHTYDKYNRLHHAACRDRQAGRRFHVVRDRDRGTSSRRRHPRLQRAWLRQCMVVVERALPCAARGAPARVGRALDGAERRRRLRRRSSSVSLHRSPRRPDHDLHRGGVRAGAHARARNVCRHAVARRIPSAVRSRDLAARHRRSGASRPKAADDSGTRGFCRKWSRVPRHHLHGTWRRYNASILRVMRCLRFTRMPGKP